MPTVNIFFTKRTYTKELENNLENLKELLAEKLTCDNIALSKEEISIRFLKVAIESSMIGPIEIEITAAAFPERIKKQDEICLEVRRYILEQNPDLSDVRVWLILSELGHSWN